MAKASSQLSTVSCLLNLGGFRVPESMERLQVSPRLSLIAVSIEAASLRAESYELERTANYSVGHRAQAWGTGNGGLESCARA